MHLIGQVNEEKGYRKFGGRPFAPLPMRDISANMRVTAKQIRQNGNSIFRKKEEFICVELLDMSVLPTQKKY